MRVGFERFGLYRWGRPLVLVAGIAGLTAALMLAFGVTAQGTAPQAQEKTLVAKGVEAERPAPSNLPDPAGLSRTFAQVVKKVERAVVNISTEQVLRGRSRRPGGPFDDFFERFFGQQLPERQRRRNSLGSGVIVDRRGYILTNNHVVEEADEITVTLFDEREFKAKVVGTDPPTDLAVLKIEGESDFPAAAIGDSDELAVGDWVLAVGNPFGLGHTVTAGIISAKGRVIRQGPYDDFLQTDAAINPGNSGGPLINMKGEVIGVNSNILSASGGNMGIGFAIPAKLVRKVYDQLVAQGSVTRGWLGVTIGNLTPDLARGFGLEGKKGALVQDLVGEDSPAARAGIKAGDVIVEFNGRKVESDHELVQLVADVNPGESVEVKFYRDGKLQTARVKLAKREIDMVEDRSRREQTDDRGRLGVTAQDLTPQLAAQVGTSSRDGVLILQVDPDGPAADAGLNRGDIIHEANREPVRKLEDLQGILAKVPAGGDLLLRIERVSGGQSSYAWVYVKPN
jgi:serine protease Do